MKNLLVKLGIVPSMDESIKLLCDKNKAITQA